ncbi:hypothetical protein DEO72_LG6g555 [Vigna unguiculata]|uniref:Uncharacterized protein n=1 Tax=Vigna unguiculata TaxID=3917 RepID=A0A4D6M5J4_VIGUN|nr:hypothetical protein DEO72_LG6g555 [Vigna unguiculata]
MWSLICSCDSDCRDWVSSSRISSRYCLVIISKGEVDDGVTAKVEGGVEGGVAAEVEGVVEARVVVEVEGEVAIVVEGEGQVQSQVEGECGVQGVSQVEVEVEVVEDVHGNMEGSVEPPPNLRRGTSIIRHKLQPTRGRAWKT